MSNRCYACEQLIDDSKLIYDELYDNYICRECEKYLEDDQDTNKMLCGDCNKFYDKEAITNIEDTMNKKGRDFIPHEYLCEECLSEWRDAMEDADTKEQLMYDFR